MTALRRRLQRVEVALRPNSNANSEMTQAALGCLSDEDLDVFHGIVEQGTQANQWTEREAGAVKALTTAFEHVGDHLKTWFSEPRPRASDIIAPKAQSSVRSSVGTFC